MTPRGDEISAAARWAYRLSAELDNLREHAERVCVRLPECYDRLSDMADTLEAVGDGLMGQALRADKMTAEQLQEIDARKGGDQCPT